ncbi:MAG: VCBS repeat-containing protein [Gammaproteobacteria bacterium]|nr:VCBS repeat-containing protein [Gammaproteobacteria bacterium]
MQAGYYAEDGTTSNFAEAARFSDSTDHTGVDIHLLEGEQISGSVNLPLGYTAPPGGIGVSLDIRGDDWFGSQWVTIDEAQNSASFDVTAPATVGDSFHVTYYLSCPDSGCGGNFVRQGYYGDTNTVFRKSQATLLASGTAHTDLQIDIALGTPIAGSIDTPPGYTLLPSDGTHIVVRVKDTAAHDALAFDGAVCTFNCSDLLTNSSGPLPYQIVVPSGPGMNWRVHYNFSSGAYSTVGYGDPILLEGYYSTTSPTGMTTYDAGEATILPSGPGYTGIDMQLLEGVEVSGTISLPGSELAPAGTYISGPIHADDDARVSGWFSIAPGTSSSNFSFYLPLHDASDRNWVFSYECQYGCGGYASRGYLGLSGMQHGPSDAATFVGGVSHANVDLVLLKPRARNDFDGDGRTDLFWRNMTNGRNVLWFMDGLSRTSSGDTLGINDPDWQLAGFGDFNGDAHTDILWRSQSSGRNVIWLMNGTTRIGEGDTVVLNDPAWELVVLKDFDGDGKTDFLWRNVNNGRNVIWFMDGTTRIGAGDTLGLDNPDWELSGFGDFNGDERADFLWRNIVNGRNVIWFMDGLDRIGHGDATTLGDSDWELAGLQDFDGDGKADFLWRNMVNGRHVMWFMDGATRVGAGDTLGLNHPDWILSGFGDFNGDGRADFLWHNQANGRNVIWFMNGTSRIDSGDTVTLPFDPWILANE